MLSNVNFLGEERHGMELTSSSFLHGHTGHHPNRAAHLHPLLGTESPTMQHFMSKSRRRQPHSLDEDSGIAALEELGFLEKINQSL